MNEIGEIEFIDSHCHLDYEQLSNDLQSIIKRAKEFNVNKLITICTSLEEIKKIEKSLQNIILFGILQAYIHTKLV